MLTLCPGTVGGELQCWGAAGSPPPSGSGSGGLCSPASHRSDSKYTPLILCNPCSSAHLRVLWEGGNEALMPCQPWRERARGNEFSVKGSSRAGVSKDESHPACKRLPKGFQNKPLHHGRERVWTRTPRDQQRDSHQLEHVHGTRGVTAPCWSWDPATKGWQPGC